MVLVCQRAIATAALAAVLAGSVQGAWAAPTASVASAAMEPYSIPRSATFRIGSASGESYEVMVAWPEGTPPAEGWPALYVLDGEDNFAIATLTARRLARAGVRSGIGEGIVVGIAAGPLARRVRDYTPPVPGYRIPAGKPAAGLETGGAGPFLDFVSGEVMPYVHKRWPVDRQREAIVGHSFGGLLALHVHLTRPDVFDTVVAVSPSLWFGNGAMMKEIPVASHETGRRVLVAEGNQPAPDGTGEENGPEAFVQKLQAADRTASISYLELPGQTHGTTMLAAMAPAIRLAFGMEKQ